MTRRILLNVAVIAALVGVAAWMVNVLRRTENQQVTEVRATEGSPSPSGVSRGGKTPVPVFNVDAVAEAARQERRDRSRRNLEEFLSQPAGSDGAVRITRPGGPAAALAALEFQRKAEQMAATRAGLTTEETGRITQIRQEERKALTTRDDSGRTVGGLITADADTRVRTDREIMSLLGAKRHILYLQELSRARDELATQAGHDDLPRDLRPRANKPRP